MITPWPLHFEQVFTSSGLSPPLPRQCGHMIFLLYLMSNDLPTYSSSSVSLSLMLMPGPVCSCCLPMQKVLIKDLKQKMTRVLRTGEKLETYWKPNIPPKGSWASGWLRASSPPWSYLRRLSGSDKASLASLISWNFFSATSSPGFLSGWYWRESLRYAFLISAAVAFFFRPRI